MPRKPTGRPPGGAKRKPTGRPPGGFKWGDVLTPEFVGGILVGVGVTWGLKAAVDIDATRLGWVAFFLGAMFAYGGVAQNRAERERADQERERPRLECPVCGAKWGSRPMEEDAK